MYKLIQKSTAIIIILYINQLIYFFIHVGDMENTV